MLRKTFIILALAALLGSCQRSPKFERTHPGERGQPPVLLDHYANKTVRPGEGWRIYLRAKDVNGDMKYIAATLHEPGIGYYNSETYLEGKSRSEFAGYLLLETPPNLDLVTNMQTFNMKILIRDWAGNRSETIDLPLTFVEHVEHESLPEQWQAAVNNLLGYIDINIRTPQEMRSRPNFE